MSGVEGSEDMEEFHYPAGAQQWALCAFRQSLSENQIWQVALLLANADKLPPAAKTIVSSPTQ